MEKEKRLMALRDGMALVFKKNKIAPAYEIKIVPQEEINMINNYYGGEFIYDSAYFLLTKIKGTYKILISDSSFSTWDLLNWGLTRSALESALKIVEKEYGFCSSDSEDCKARIEHIDALIEEVGAEKLELSENGIT